MAARASKKKTTVKAATKKAAAKTASKKTSKKPLINQVLIIYRNHTKSALKRAEELADWLGQKGLHVYSHPNQTLTACEGKVTQKLLNSLDLVIVLGGDGTYLEAVRLLAGREIPILGVNLGSLGFLTEVSVEDLYRAVGMTLEGKMERRPRSMIEVQIRGKGQVKKFTALNDVVLERGASPHLLPISLFAQKLHVLDVRADGLIIATPTGSTAYNLAAGGPILHPYVASWVITPICPHSLTNRPIIFPDSEVLSLKIKHLDRRATLTVDGVSVGQVDFGDEVFIRKSKSTHHILFKPSHNYFYLLRDKLNFGENTVE